MHELNTQTFLYPVFTFLYNTLGPDSMFSGITLFIGQWFPYILVLIPLVYELFLRDQGGTVRALFRIYTAPVVAYGIVAITKFLHPLPRPFADTVLNIAPLIQGENPNGSFPSSHTAIFAALGVAMYFCNPKLGKWFLLSALLIGIARIGAGVHWPIDILCGFVLGVVVGIIVEGISRLLWKKGSPAC